MKKTLKITALLAVALSVSMAVAYACSQDQSGRCTLYAKAPYRISSPDPPLYTRVKYEAFVVCDPARGVPRKIHVRVMGIRRDGPSGQIMGHTDWKVNDCLFVRQCSSPNVSSPLRCGLWTYETYSSRSYWVRNSDGATFYFNSVHTDQSFFGDCNGAQQAQDAGLVGGETNTPIDWGPFAEDPPECVPSPSVPCPTPD